MFKNLSLYRIGTGWPTSAAGLEIAIAAESFTECSATQQKSTGWVPPREKHAALVESVAGQWIARFAIETKAVPAEAVRKHADEAAAEIERTSGRKPGKKERRDLRDDALQALLPHAFPRRKNITVWIDPERRLLAIDSASQSVCDEVVTSLVRVAGKGFSVALVQTATAPQAAMANWLAAESADEIPVEFHVERECELKGCGDEPALVKFSRHDLATEEIRQHIAQGKLPTKLAMGWQGRVGFTLTHTLQLRKITFSEGLFDKAGDTPADDRFDTDVTLTTGELAPMLDALVAALGGEPAAEEGAAP